MAPRDAAARLAALGTAAVVADAATSEPAGADRTLDDKMASQTTGLLKRFRPGQSLDAEIASYERTQEAPVEVAEAVVAAEVISSAAEPAETGRDRPRARRSRPGARTGRPRAGSRGPGRAGARRSPFRPRPTSSASPPGRWSPRIRRPTPRPASRRRCRPRRAPSTRPANRSGRSGRSGRAAARPPACRSSNRPATPQGGIEALWAAVERRGRATPTGPAKPAGGVAALRQLRAVTLRHRPVLPALRDPPGRLTPRARSASSRTRTQAAP